MTFKPFDEAAAGAPAGAQALYSPESEKLLIATLLNEPRKELAERMLGRIGPSDFHIDEHAAVWRVAQSLNDHQLGFDVVAIIDYSRNHNIYVGGTDYVFNLAEDPVLTIASEESIKAAATRVKELSGRRLLKNILLTGVSLCDSGQPYDQIHSLIEDDLLNLRKQTESGKTGPRHIRDGLSGLLDRLQRQQDGEILGRGTSTGFQQLDEITSGLMDEDFIILAARPSMGKTAFCLNLARNGAATGRPSLIFSLEMKELALTQRLLGRESRVSLSSLRSATLSADGWDRVIEGATKLEGLPIWIDDTPGLTMNNIRSRARSFVAAHGPCTIYIDYLQHIAKNENTKLQSDEKTHVSEVSRSAKGLARELKSPVVGLSQLNRTLEQRANKRPIMSDLRESGALEQDADLIMFIYRDEVYNPETSDQGVAEIIIAKQRDGAIGTVPLGFQRETGLFTDLPY